jgi:hypothetical protein
MKSTLEREVTLRGGSRFEGVSLPGEPIPERTLVSAYHDADDLLADIQDARKDTARTRFPAAWRKPDKRGRALA